MKRAADWLYAKQLREVGDLRVPKGRSLVKVYSASSKSPLSYYWQMWTCRLKMCWNRFFVPKPSHFN